MFIIFLWFLLTVGRPCACFKKIFFFLEQWTQWSLLRLQILSLAKTRNIILTQNPPSIHVQDHNVICKSHTSKHCNHTSNRQNTHLFSFVLTSTLLATLHVLAVICNDKKSWGGCLTTCLTACLSTCLLHSIFFTSCWKKYNKHKG